MPASNAPGLWARQGCAWREAAWTWRSLTLGLPDSQGLDTCRRIREVADRAAVVIVLTGNLDEEIGSGGQFAKARMTT